MVPLDAPDATTLSTELATGALTAEKLARICLDRISERDALVGAWAHLDAPSALAVARAIDVNSRPGALAGLPVGVKDVIQTRDMPTRYNCALYDNPDPTPDAACVALLRNAGALILGKTETVELAAIGRVARTRNPHAPDHTPGGSSSGSAAAVADGHVPVAIGTQTGGSIIRPASFCGVWALKPSWGTVSNEGAKAFAPSLDTIGWFGRSARDLALVLNALSPSAPDVPALTLEGAKIAVWRTVGWPRAEAETQAAMARTIAAIEQSGGEVVEFAVPASFDGLVQAHWTIMFAEGRRSFLAEYRRDRSLLHPRIQAMVEDGGGFSTSAVRAAYNLAAHARELFDALATGADAVLAPSTLGAAPVGLEATGDLLFNGLFTLLHVPCVNMPVHRTSTGLPVGLTLTGARFSDAKVIAAAAEIARACARMNG